jgi:zinc transport system permease protein
LVCGVTPIWRYISTIMTTTTRQTDRSIMSTTRIASMIDDFFVRAILAGAGLALITGPLGCFVIWKRLAYFGDTLSHGALLGIALGLLFELNLELSVFVICTLVATTLMILQRRSSISSDALLGILAHASLAIGLVVLSLMTWIRVDLMGLLFGDILAVSKSDLWMIGATILVTGAVLAIIWRALFAATVSRELAEAEGIRAQTVEMMFLLLIAAVIAIAIKIVGVLLITSLLIIPAAAARRISITPGQMMIASSVVGVVSVILGLLGSLNLDTPSGPSIVVAAVFCFLLSISPLGDSMRTSLRSRH